MDKLIVKLPFKGKLRNTNNENEQNTKKVTTSTQRSRKYRQKLKNDPAYKQKLTELRIKKKDQNKAYSEKVKVKRETNKKYDEYIKERDKLRKRLQRKIKAQNKQNALEEKKVKTPRTVKSKPAKQATIRKRAERVNRSLPKESTSWAETLNHIVKNATPKRKSMIRLPLIDKNPSSGCYEALHDVLGVKKAGRPKKHIDQIKKRLAYSEESEAIWCSKKQAYQYKRRKNLQLHRESKKIKFIKVWQPKIEKHLEDYSRIMPNKKDTILINKKNVAKRHLLYSKLKIYQKFRKAHPDFKKSFSTFNRMIPKNYRSLNTTCRRVCVCCKHYNMEQKVEALNKLALKKLLPELKSTVRQLSDITVCPFENMPERACIDRDCKNCGTHAITSNYAQLTDICSENDRVKFFQWEKINESYLDKEGKHQKSNRWVQVSKMADANTLVNDVANDMSSFTGHIFRTDYQHKMETNLMTNLPIDHCVVVMDFSENISLVPQDEIEGSHWTTKQVTLHPIHIVRHAPNSTTAEPVIMQESLIIISNSLAHDANSVYVYTKQLMLHLDQNPGPCKISVLHRFSDNCATQYKSKYAFMHLSLFEEVHDIKVIYHYTESGHGKSQCDGYGAAIKKRLERLILSGRVVVNNAYQVYLALLHSQPEETSQKIIYVPQKKITKDSPPKAIGVKTLPGTQKLHMVYPKPGHPGVLVCNDLSCTCAVCTTDQEGPCFFSKYRQPPKIHRIMNKEKIDSTDDQNENTSILCGDGNSYDYVIADSLLAHQDHQQRHVASIESFSREIKDQGWKIRGETPSDGNCFFWAVSDQLDRLGLEVSTHRELREKLVNYMKSMSEAEQVEISHFLTTDLDSYLSGMSKDGTYVDHIVVNSLVKVLGHPIKVFHADIMQSVTVGDFESRFLAVGYLPDINHYISLEPIRYEPDDFVAVCLSNRRRKRLYVAKVLEANGDNILMKFLVQKKWNEFVWPTREDIGCQPVTDIIMKLTNPVLAPGRGLILIFDGNEINMCLKIIK